MIAAIYTPDGLIKKNRDTSLDKIAPRRTCLSRPSYVLRFSIETVYFRCLSRFEILLQNLEWTRDTWLHLNANIFLQIPFPLFRIILLFFLKIDFFLFLPDLRRIQEERLDSSNLDQSWNWPRVNKIFFPRNFLSSNRCTYNCAPKKISHRLSRSYHDSGKVHLHRTSPPRNSTQALFLIAR